MSYLRLPQPFSSLALTRPVTQHPITVPAPAPTTGVPRALVVDDEPTIRSAIVRYLRKRGWDADEAEDGETAQLKLERVSPGGYQVVISDILMPRCAGDELHDWLASHRPDLFVRLILISGDLSSPIVGQFVARTPRPVIAKPFDLTELADMVEAVLSGR